MAFKVKIFFNIQLFFLDIASEASVCSQTAVPGADVYEHCAQTNGSLNKSK
jgi:hypothetical protein